MSYKLKGRLADGWGRCSGDAKEVLDRYHLRCRQRRLRPAAIERGRDLSLVRMRAERCGPKVVRLKPDQPDQPDQPDRWLRACNTLFHRILGAKRARTLKIMRMRAFRRKMADRTSTEQCWIYATEQFQRKTHKLFDLRYPLST